MRIVWRGMSVDFKFDSYADCWKWYWRLNIFLAAWFFGIPALMWLEVKEFKHTSLNYFFAMDAIWCFVLMVLAFGQKYWPCPRCGETFNPIGTFRVFPRKCASCGLDRKEID